MRRPVNKKACPLMNKLVEGLVRRVPRERARVVLRVASSSGRRRVADCGNGKKNCMDYSQWVKAWNEVIS